MKRILVADVPQMDARYSAALAGWEIAFARTMSEARQALGGRRDLVAIGVYFDDSRMFDLVRVLRGDELHAGVPIVCVRGRPGFTAVTGRTLELTLKALTPTSSSIWCISATTRRATRRCAPSWSG